MSDRRRARVLGTGAVLAGLAAAALVSVGVAAGAPTVHPATGPHWRSCASGPGHRQAAFDRAARVSGVPRSVLLGLSYMESRWDDHGTSPSTAGGYGPMNLTHVVSQKLTRSDIDPMGKGDGRPAAKPPLWIYRQHVSTGSMRQLDRAAALTGLSTGRLRSDAAANICGGAALLAHYQREAGVPTVRLGDWSAAVARYSGATDRPTALRFVHQVFAKVRHGVARTTNDGQRVHLAAHPGARPSTSAVSALRLAAKVPTSGVDCPPDLGCGSVPAPYDQTSASGDYGNHDIADRPHAGMPKIDYIVIHDTEATWDETLKLVQDPTYVSWNYSVRSGDGHIDQHVDNKDVAYHAGNWYVNMHSIGIEHEGFAPQGATWFTEAMYENSATLVRHLTQEYGIPVDRAHIIGHDQVPGINPAGVKGMHWDPGPYWDWEHYFALLGHPIAGHGKGANAVTVAPGFATNQQAVNGCDVDGSGTPCPAQGTNFVYLHQSPSDDSPLVTDIGQHPDGSPSTTDVADVSARAAAGAQLAVAARNGDWLGVWWLGQIAWLHNPAGQPAVRPSTGSVVQTRGDTAVPVYGTAYPAQTDYPSDIPYDHPRVPLQYTIKPGQSYVLADRNIQTDYYYAEAFNCVGALECTDVPGANRFYEIWFGHRMVFVRAADVRIR